MRRSLHSNKLVANEQRDSYFGTPVHNSFDVTRIASNVGHEERFLVGRHPAGNTFLTYGDTEVLQDLLSITSRGLEVELLATLIGQQDGTMRIVEEILNDTQDFIQELPSS
jgi:hypothetical protein